jgi:hypothetical protein
MRATTTMKKNWGRDADRAPGMFSRMGLTDWKKVAADAWNAPSWREAVREYHRDRAWRRLIVEIEPEHKPLKRLMRPGVTLEQAYRELNDPRNRPTPKVHGRSCDGRGAGAWHRGVERAGHSRTTPTL